MDDHCTLAAAAEVPGLRTTQTEPHRVEPLGHVARLSGHSKWSDVKAERIRRDPAEGREPRTAAGQVEGSLSILGIAGSLRRASFNRGLIRAASDVAPRGITVDTFDLIDVPLFNADVEAMGDPPAVVALKAAIQTADALLIASPEYNHCIPGVLKNAIDWASRPARASALSGKPVAIMGASPGRGGTARAQAQLRDGLTYTNGFVLPLPEVLVSLADEKFDGDGNLVDEETRAEVRDLLVALAAWTRRLRQTTNESIAS